MHMENLANAGVDLVLIETMNSVREAAVASRIAREAGLPFLVSFTSWNSARLLSGERLEEAVQRVVDHGPLAVLVNCLPASAVSACLPALQCSGLPFGVYINLGEPGAEGDFLPSEEHSPEEFAAHALSWIEAGARIVGGCCGTTPDHIRAAGRGRLPG
jgi:S-methylmethionine-dependent homocysteine/selenocysteine methylase